MEHANRGKRLKIDGHWVDAAEKVINKPVPPEGVPPPKGKGTIPQRAKKKATPKAARKNRKS